MDIEIQVTNIKYPLATLDSMSFSRQQAEVFFKLFLGMGLTKDAKFFWDDESGKVHVMKKIYYESPSMPEDGDDGKREGGKYYTLGDYIKLLVRFDRSANKRMKSVRSKINQMHRAIDKLNKQL